jgi:hypothetical protein
MTADMLRTKYPTMSDATIERLLLIDKSEVPTLEPKLCRIDEPNCESCQ